VASKTNNPVVRDRNGNPFSLDAIKRGRWQLKVLCTTSIRHNAAEVEKAYQLAFQHVDPSCCFNRRVGGGPAYEFPEGVCTACGCCTAVSAPQGLEYVIRLP